MAETFIKRLTENITELRKTSGLELELIENESDFLNLKEDWNNLCQNPINSFEWSYAWWKNLGKNYALKIIRACFNGKTLGIAPLCIQTARVLKISNVKSLCFIGNNISDYLGFLIKEGEDRELIFSFLLDFALNKLSYDFVEFKQINSSSIDIELWEKYAKLYDFEIIESGVNKNIELSEYCSYQEYFENLSKKHKANTKNKINKIKKSGLNFYYFFKEDIDKSDIELISEMNIKRQKFLYEKGFKKRDSQYADSNKKSFLSKYLCNKLNKSKMLAYLKCENKIIAYVLFFKSKDTLFYWDASFDVEYEKFSPSIILLNESIKYAFENNYKFFDFIRGDDNYKKPWANISFYNYNFVKNSSAKAKIISKYRKKMPAFFFGRFRKNKIKILEV